MNLASPSNDTPDVDAKYFGSDDEGTNAQLSTSTGSQLELASNPSAHHMGKVRSFGELSSVGSIGSGTDDSSQFSRTRRQRLNRKNKKEVLKKHSNKEYRSGEVLEELRQARRTVRKKEIEIDMDLGPDVENISLDTDISDNVSLSDNMSVSDNVSVSDTASVGSAMGRSKYRGRMASFRAIGDRTQKNLLMKVGGTKTRRSSCVESPTIYKGSSTNQNAYNEQYFSYLKDLIEKDDKIIEEGKIHMTTENDISKFPGSDLLADQYLFDDEDGASNFTREFIQSSELVEEKRYKINIPNLVTAIILLSFVIITTITLPKPSIHHKAKQSVITGVTDPNANKTPSLPVTLKETPQDKVQETPQDKVQETPQVEHKEPKPKLNKNTLISLLLPLSPDINKPESPQSQALNWLIGTQTDLPVERLVVLYIFAAFYYSTGGTQWKTDDWLSDTVICNWTGIRCTGDNDATVTSLSLISSGLKGTIPYELTHLENLGKKSDDHLKFAFKCCAKSISLNTRI